MDVLLAYRILFLGTAAFVVYLAVRDSKRAREQKPALTAEPVAFEPEPVSEAPAAFRPGSYFKRAENVLNPLIAERIRVLHELLREGTISQQEHDSIIGRVQTARPKP